MGVNLTNLTAYGLSQPLIDVMSPPIVAKRAPNTNDYAPVGTIWTEPSTDSVWIESGIISNVANWVNVSGGAGSFSSLTVTPGPTSLTGIVTMNAGAGNAIHIGIDATDHPVSIGSFTGASQLSLGAGTAGATLYTAATGTIIIGAANMTGTVTLGSSTVGQAIRIGTGSAANVVTIGSRTNAANTILYGGTAGIQLATSVTGTISIGDDPMTGIITLGQSTAAAGQTINIGNAINTGAQIINIASGNAAGVTTVNILNGVASAGSQNLNIMNETAGLPGFINIGTGTAAHTVRIGSFTGAATTTILGGTGGVVLSAPFVSLSGPVYIYTGSGAPANGLALHAGDLYINTTASTTTTRLYIATGAGAWTYFTSNA
jgi:hypothetical protein